MHLPCSTPSQAPPLPPGYHRVSGKTFFFLWLEQGTFFKSTFIPLALGRVPWEGPAPHFGKHLAGGKTLFFFG